MALNLDLTETEEILRNTALTFLRRDMPKDLLQSLLETDTGYNEKIWKKAVDMGWPGIIIPEKYGGTDTPLTSAGVLFEALGTGPLPGPYFSSGILGSLIILGSANEVQKDLLLPALVAGERIVALALTEPEYSWEPSAVQTTAKLKDGNFVIDGLKLFIQDAGAATHFIVVARTGEGADPSKGLSLFLVDKEAPGVSVSQVPGFLIGRSFEVKLSSVKISQSDMLGNKDQGWPVLELAIQKSIPVLCAYKVGGCQSLIDMAVEYSRVREQFGQPIGRFQRVQDHIIDMVHHTEAARWATYEALWKLDTQRPAAESVHLAKVLASHGYWEVVTLAHQVFSGISYSKEHSASYHTRTSRSLYSFLGEPAYHRQKLARLLTT
ncbi:MAG: acyl-CoA dehydrogenase family protein [Deltaproteobacteria bacterium]|nr:acyl-CoA dehydrogenase family protein [Deltaproteobacteria bacterium]